MPAAARRSCASRSADHQGRRIGRAAGPPKARGPLPAAAMRRRGSPDARPDVGSGGHRACGGASGSEALTWRRPASRSSRPSTRPRPACSRAMLRVGPRQSFNDWELCLVDDCSTRRTCGEILDGEARRSRIRVGAASPNGGIVAASNDALAMAAGEFVALLDHDDELHPDALAEVDAAMLASPEADYVYTDEDKIDASGRPPAPFFKPDWSPERMRTRCTPATSACSAARWSRRSAASTRVRGLPGLGPAAEGHRAGTRGRARAPGALPLAHARDLGGRRRRSGETVGFEAGKRAVQAHCERIGLPARVSATPATQASTSWNRAARGPAGEHRHPDRRALARGALRGGPGRPLRAQHRRELDLPELRDRLRRRRLDTPPAVLDDYRRSAASACGWSTTTNPSTSRRRSTVGAVHSEGEHLLLLNDDMEVATPDWIERMVMYSGCRGRRRRRPPALGGRPPPARRRPLRGRPPRSPYRGFSGDFNGYANNVRVAQNSSPSPAPA